MTLALLTLGSVGFPVRTTTAQYCLVSFTALARMRNHVKSLRMYSRLLIAES